MISITPIAFLGSLQQTPPKNTASSAFSSTPRSASADRFERSTSQAVQLRSGYSEAEFINQLIERGFSEKEAGKLPSYFKAFSGQAIIDRHQRVIAHLLTIPPTEIKRLSRTLGLSTADCMRKLVLLDPDALKLLGATPQSLLEQTIKQLGDNATALNNPTDKSVFQETIGELAPFLQAQLPQNEKMLAASLQARIAQLPKQIE